jgi:hypothetical protein
MSEFERRDKKGEKAREKPEIPSWIQGTEAAVATMPQLPILAVEQIESAVTDRLDEVAQVVEKGFSAKLKELAKQAALTKDVGRITSALIRLKALPLAINDTLTYMWTAAQVDKHEASAQKVEKRWRASMRTAFRFYYGYHIAEAVELRHGASKDDAQDKAFVVAGDLVSDRLKALGKRAAKSEVFSKESELDRREEIGKVAFITEVTIQDRERLKEKIRGAMLEKRVIQAVTLSPEADGERIANMTVEVMKEICREEGIDFGESLVEIPVEAFNPYMTLPIIDAVGKISKPHAEVVNGALGIVFEQVKEVAVRVNSTFVKIMESGELTDSQRRKFIGEIMIAIGIPKEDARVIFQVSREAYGTSDVYAMLNSAEAFGKVIQAAACLHVASRDAARNFVTAIAEITGADTQGVEAFMKALQDRNVEAALATGAGSGAGRIFRRQLARLWDIPLENILGLPNPLKDPGRLLMHLSDRVRETWWLTTLNATVLGGVAIASAISGTTGGEYFLTPERAWQLFLTFEGFIPFQLLTRLLPGLKTIPFTKIPTSLSLEQVANIVEGWNIPGLAQLASHMKSLPIEGIGIGLEPFEFSTEDEHVWRRWETPAVQGTWAMRTKAWLATESDQGAYQIHTRDRRGRYGYTRRSPRYDIKLASAVSPIPEVMIAHMEPLLGLINPILAPVNEVYRQHIAPIAEIWRSRELKIPTTAGDPTPQRSFAAGTVELLMSLAAPIFPKTSTYRTMDYGTVITTRPSGESEVEKKSYPIPRRFLGSAFLGNLMDASSMHLALLINLGLIRSVGLDKPIQKASQWLLHDTPLGWEIGLSVSTLGAHKYLGWAAERLVAPETLAWHDTLVDTWNQLSGGGINWGNRGIGSKGSGPDTGGDFTVDPGQVHNPADNLLDAGSLGSDFLEGSPIHKTLIYMEEQGLLNNADSAVSTKQGIEVLYKNGSTFIQPIIRK